MKKILYLLISLIMLIGINSCSSSSSITSNVDKKRLIKLVNLPGGSSLFIDKNYVSVTNKSLQNMRLFLLNNTKNDSYNITFKTDNSITLSPKSCLLNTRNNSCIIAVRPLENTEAGVYKIISTVTSLNTKRSVDSLPITVLLSAAQAEEKDILLHYSVNTVDEPTVKYIGTINENDTINITVPYGTSLKNLISNYVTNGVSVLVNNNLQNSGISINDFTNPVMYTVISANGLKKNYTVKVINALNSAKDLNNFLLAGQLKPTVVVDNNILVLFSQDTDFSIPTVASYTTTGKDVLVNGQSQKYGSEIKFTPNVPVTYTVVAEDGSKKDYIVRVIIDAKTITNFSINNTLDNTPAIATINQNQIIMYVKNNTDVTKLISNFVVPYGVKVTVTDSKTTQDAISGETVVDFTNPVTYTVTDEYGDTTYTVTLTKSSFFYVASRGEEGKNLGYITRCNSTFDNCNNLTVVKPEDKSNHPFEPRFMDINNDNTKIYITNLITNSVYICNINIDGSFYNCTENRNQLFTNPQGITFDKLNNNSFYISNRDSGNIVKCTMNEMSCSVVGSSNISHASIVLDSSGNGYSVGNYEAVSSFSQGFSNINKIFDASKFFFPVGIILSEDETKIYVSNGDNTVTSCDINTTQCTKSARGLSAYPGISVKDGALYATDLFANRVMQCSLPDNSFSCKYINTNLPLNGPFGITILN